MLIHEIIEKVEALRKQYSLDSVPVNLSKLLEGENIKVIDRDFTKHEEQASKSISGMLYIDNDSKFILVNERDNPRRKNFTIAHELGHYYLHYDKDSKSEVFVSFRGDSNPTETEANRFAAELLLPDDKVKMEYGSAIFPMVSYLADKFNVSEQAMGIKLEQMGLSYIGL